VSVGYPTSCLATYRYLVPLCGSADSGARGVMAGVADVPGAS
jgi:hypothetical protein